MNYEVYQNVSRSIRLSTKIEIIRKLIRVIKQCFSQILLYQMLQQIEAYGTQSYSCILSLIRHSKFKAFLQKNK